MGRAIPASANGACLGLVQGACVSHGPGLGRQGEAQGSAGDGLVRRKPPLEISTVEPHPPVSSRGQGQETTTQRGDAANPGAALCIAKGAGGDSFPLHSQTYGNHGIAGDLLPRFVQPGHGTASMGSHDEAPRKLRFATYWSCLQESGAPTNGREDPGDHRAAMRRASTLFLGNVSNHCYMNSWVQVMLWTIELDAEARLPQMGRCAQFFRHLCGLTGRGQRFLTKDLMWQPLIRGWKDINRQHDVVEFAAHMFARHGVALVQGEWEARTGLPMVGQPGDAGQCSQPLLLHLPHLPPGLAALQVQSLVDQWHAQEAIHAFTVAPSILVMDVSAQRMVA